MTNTPRADVSEPRVETTGAARVAGRADDLLHRLQAGDIAVVDQADLDLMTAQGLIEAGVLAVLTAGPVLSGRYPSVGAEALAGAGVQLIDGLGDAGYAAIADGRTIGLRRGVVLLGTEEIARGRVVSAAMVREEMTQARAGLLAQLDTFTHNASEFLRREQDLVLGGVGLPRLRTAIAGRPVMVVARVGDHEAELQSVHRFIREQNPILITVDRATDDVLDFGLAPHVVVLSSSDPATMPSLDGMRAADDVVVRLERGAAPSMLDSLARLGMDAQRCETAATAEDVALLLADAAHAGLVVGVGVHADLVELLDHQRAGLASTYLTRLKLGHTLVDAASIPYLYTGRIQPWHLLLVALAGCSALAAAIAVTPVGQVWLDGLSDWSSAILDSLQGLF